MRSLKYSVEKYNFRKNSYYGSVVVRGESSIEETIENQTRSKVLGDLINNLDNELEKHLKEGYAIDIAGFVTLRPSLKGLFKSKEDSFDPERHNIEIITEPGIKLQRLNRKNNFKTKKVPSLRK